MADMITFDFENDTIIINVNGQDSIEIDKELKSKRAAILDAAGLEEVDLRKDINAMFREFGSNIVCEGSDDEDIAAAEAAAEAFSKMTGE